MWVWLMFLLLCSLSAPLLTQNITIGMTAPLYLDPGMRTAAGLAFALEEANRAGGVLSRSLTLVVLNDNYNVTTSMANLNYLLDDVGVLLLAGLVGSDLAVQSKPLILQRGVPSVGAFTGTTEVRTPFHREFVNLRVSYADEMVAQSLFLVQYARVKRIACLYQNDSFGIGSHAALVAALAQVGIELVASGAYTHGQTDVEAAVAAIAGAPLRAQAVVLAAVEDAAVRFITLFHATPRADPDCVFTVLSSGWGVSYSTALPLALWGQIFFLSVVPLPADPGWAIATHFAAAYSAAGNMPEPTAFEGYITGRFIVEVLRRIRSQNVTRQMFLDEVYTDRLFVLDDLVVGMYSTNYSGCSQAICACNSGLRSVFMAQLDPSTAMLGPSLSTVRFSVLECSNSVTNVIAPLLFGQLLPTLDTGWYAVAVEVGRGVAEAFAEANLRGGAGHRDFVLLQQNYSSNSTQAMDTLANRYPLVALLGSVVLQRANLTGALTALIGNIHTEPDVADAAFVWDEISLQPATSLELMTLAQWAALNCPVVHLRAPASSAGQQLLGLMTASIQSFQVRAASSATYSPGGDILSSVLSGCVIAVGSTMDLLSWYVALPQYPGLHLLVLNAPAMWLMEVLPNASDLPQASRLLFPTLITGPWNATTPNPQPSEAWKYGYILGQAVTQALTHSEYADRSYTTATELLTAWYTVKVMTAGVLTLGPYDGANCTSDGPVGCECSEGARSMAVRTVASPAVQATYSIAACHVGYTPLVDPNSGGATLPLVVGLAVGVGCLVAASAALFLRLTKRNNSAAPKDTHRPFCVLFTDIQASTHLWASLPEVMAHALSTHHMLIRRLINKHKCYEVKTIGDSFMCATHSPLQAVRLALAIQTALHDQDWGTDAINATYCDCLDPEDVGQVSRSCWNGLRVRVGVHYGLGEIQLDPVTKGYDYYGTVVNTAARIESVCHGGQIGVSQVVYDAVRSGLADVVWADLGAQPLRGLNEPIRLYQALPAGRLACRTFPPLRLHKQDTVPDFAEGEVEIVTAVLSQRSSQPACEGKPNSVVPADSVESTMENWQWVETHPLVLRGDVGTEEMKCHFAIALATLSTLLTTQTEKVRQQMVQGLCERLHVANCGLQGTALQCTLRGLVHRVLPATVVTAQQQLQRGRLTRHDSSKLSSPRTPALVLQPITPNVCPSALS